MIILILLLIISILIIIKYTEDIDIKYMSLLIPFFILTSFLIIWGDKYSQYIKNKSIISIYEESIKIKTEELENTISIQENDNIFKNKHNKNVIALANKDNPIRSTNEYLESIQKERIKERNEYIQAKKGVFQYRNGFFGWLLF